jgi:diadenylate cyclase
MIAELLWYVQRLDFFGVLDILLVAITFFSIIYLVRGTRAAPLLRGIIILVIILIPLSGLIRLPAFGWLIQRALPALLVAIPVVFQQELRRTLERLGRAGLLLRQVGQGRAEQEQVLDDVVRASQALAEMRHGALIVLERQTGLQEVADTGVALHADVTADLLTTIFDPHTALHDGAAIVRGKQVIAAGCVLSLSNITLPDRKLGLRHRAAIGVTEESDAVAIAVSEERGAISLAHDGGLVRDLGAEQLKKRLVSLYQPMWERARPRWRSWIRHAASSLRPRVVLRWMVRNASLMILCLIVAALAWAVALDQRDPTIEQLYPQSIPIVVPEPPQGLVIVEQVDESAQVTLRAPQSVWRALDPNDFSATVDLASLGPGTHRVPVQVSVDSRPARIVAVEPEQVTLELEPYAERVVDVYIRVVGEPALGYTIQSPVVEPVTVTVSGPRPDVDRVVEVAGVVSAGNAEADVDASPVLEPRDTEGQPVSHVVLSSRTADVRVPVKRSSYYRPMAIKVVLKGQVAPGYHIVDISVEPPVVTLFGAPDATAALPGYVETEPVDVEGAKDNVVVRPALNLPPNVALIPVDEALVVEISIEAVQSSLTVEVVPEPLGLSPGLTVTTSLEPVEVILNGPLSQLESLEAGDVRAVLNLFDLSSGIQQIKPEVIAPEGIIVRSVSPPILQVEISNLPASEPTDK